MNNKLAIIRNDHHRKPNALGRDDHAQHGQFAVSLTDGKQECDHLPEVQTLLLHAMGGEPWVTMAALDFHSDALTKSADDERRPYV